MFPVLSRFFQSPASTDAAAVPLVTISTSRDRELSKDLSTDLHSQEQLLFTVFCYALFKLASSFIHILNVILCSILYTFNSYFISLNSLTWILAALAADPYNTVSFYFVKTTLINHLTDYRLLPHWSTTQ